jgi:molecular chaperone IbpA
MKITDNQFPDPYDKHGMAPYGKPPYPYEPWDKKDKWQKAVPAPKVVTINDLFPRLDRLSIGWSPLLEQLKEVTQNKPSYPPYDIVALKDDKEDVTLLNVAVAGFSKNEISVTVQDSVVTIEGEKEEKQEGEIVYQGIATRNFKLSLAIAEYWEVTHANLENGMLTVQFNKNLPEEKKPTVIPVR